MDPTEGWQNKLKQQTILHGQTTRASVPKDSPNCSTLQNYRKDLVEWEDVYRWLCTEYTDAKN